MGRPKKIIINCTDEHKKASLAASKEAMAEKKEKKFKYAAGCFDPKRDLVSRGRW